MLAEHGWHRGFFFNDEGEVCALGALHVAAGTMLNTEGYKYEEISPLRHAVLRLAIDAVGDSIPAQFTNSTIASFNDLHARSSEDIQLLFKNAIHQLETRDEPDA